MDHGKVVTRGWEIGWNHKWLFGLGALAALTGGIQAGGSQGAFDFTSFANFDPESGELPPFLDNGPFADAIEAVERTGDPTALLEAFGPMLGVLSGVLAVTALLGIVFWFVGLIARAGLVLSVNELEEGRKMSFGEGFRSGTAFVVPLFLMKLLLAVLTFVVIAVFIGLGVALGIGAAASGGDGAIGVIVVGACLTICLIVPLSISLSYIDAYAFRGIVLNNKGVGESLGHGWSVLRNNLGDNFLLGIIFWVLALVISTIIGFILLPLGFLFSNPILEFMQNGTLPAGALGNVIIGSIVMTAVSAILTGILATWQSASFTVAYREFMGMTPAPIFEPIGEEKQPDPSSFDDMV